MAQPTNDDSEFTEVVLVDDEETGEPTQKSTAFTPPAATPDDDEFLPCDPLTSVPPDLRLLVSRLSAAPPAPADSIAALTVERTTAAPVTARASLLPARRGPSPTTIAAAVAVGMVIGATSFALFRGGSTTTASTDVHRAMPTQTEVARSITTSTKASTLAAPQNTALAQSAPVEAPAAQTTARPTSHRHHHAAGSPAAAPSPETTSAAPAVAEPSVDPASANSVLANVPASSETTAAPAGAPTLEQQLQAAAPAASAEPQPANLHDAMRAMVGDRKEEAPVDAPRVVAVPDQPSVGATSNALRAVLPKASACLGPDDTVRKGRVVFAPDGSVARVELAGSTPEDDCIRTVLSKAKVPPFRDETFAAPVTVRPRAAE